MIETRSTAQPIERFAPDEIPEDFGTGRRCRVCDAFLCRYNPEPICWVHQPEGDGVLIEVGPGEWCRFDVVETMEADKRKADWSDRFRRVTAVLSEFPDGLRSHELAAQLAVNESTISRWVRVMADAGLIEHASRYSWRLPQPSEADEIREVMEATA